jgi:hypothetical protein
MTDEEEREAFEIWMMPWRMDYEPEKVLEQCERRVKQIQQKDGYKAAVKTMDWWIAKQILFHKKANYEQVECVRCGRLLSFHQATMHHVSYDPLFELENVRFVCYGCHKLIHNK